MSVIRKFSRDDETAFVQMQDHAFRELEYSPRLKLGLPAMVTDGSFVAEKDGSMAGCIGLVNLDRPGWFEVRNLALLDPSDIELGAQLVNSVVKQVGSMNPQYLKASTPAVQPYVDIYKSAGFEPVRRFIRVRWDMLDVPMKTGGVKTRQLSSSHAAEAANVWVEGLRPYWDYWIEESGGAEEVRAWAKESVSKGQGKGWIGAFIDEKLVGLALLRNDAYGPGEARFNGAYVLPSHRGHGIGSALMPAVIDDASQARQKSMRVYTLAFLDHLAPGLILYLKSGGRIEAEYLQLQKKISA